MTWYNISDILLEQFFSVWPVTFAIHLRRAFYRARRAYSVVSAYYHITSIYIFYIQPHIICKTIPNTSFLTFLRIQLRSLLKMSSDYQKVDSENSIEIDRNSETTSSSSNPFGQQFLSFFLNERVICYMILV